MALMDLRIDDLRARRSAARAPFCLELLVPPKWRGATEWMTAGRRAWRQTARGRDGRLRGDPPPADSDRRGRANAQEDRGYGASRSRTCHAGAVRNAGLGRIRRCARAPRAPSARPRAALDTMADGGARPMTSG